MGNTNISFREKSTTVQSKADSLHQTIVEAGAQFIAELSASGAITDPNYCQRLIYSRENDLNHFLRAHNQDVLKRLQLKLYALPSESYIQNNLGPATQANVCAEIKDFIETKIRLIQDISNTQTCAFNVDWPRLDSFIRDNAVTEDDVRLLNKHLDDYMKVIVSSYDELNALEVDVRKAFDWPSLDDFQIAVQKAISRNTGICNTYSRIFSNFYTRFQTSPSRQVRPVVQRPVVQPVVQEEFVIRRPGPQAEPVVEVVEEPLRASRLNVVLNQGRRRRYRATDNFDAAGDPGLLTVRRGQTVVETEASNPEAEYINVRAESIGRVGLVPRDILQFLNYV